VSSTDHSAPHYVVFSTPQTLLPLIPTYAPQNHIPNQHHPTFLPQFEPHGFIPTHNSRRNHISVYCTWIFIIFRNELMIKILYRMTASVPRLQFSLNFFLKKILIRQCSSYILKTSTLSKGLWFRPAFWSRVMTMYLVLCLVQSP